MKTDTIRPSAILRRAMALIDTPDKWCQWGMEIGRAKCALQALDTACGGGEDRHIQEICPAAYHALIAAAGAEPGNIGAWNDAPGRTHAEVIAAFTKAAESLEAGERKPSRPSSTASALVDTVQDGLVRAKANRSKK